MSAIIGRKKEIQELRKAIKSDESQLVAVYGRRRIGKTFLIDQFIKEAKNDLTLDKKIFKFNISAKHNSTAPKHFKKIQSALKKQFNLKNIKKPRSWSETFGILDDCIIEKQKEFDKIIIFFDEFPWFQTQGSSFLEEFISWWETYGSKHDKLIMVISGSDVSWMLNNILNNSKDLHKRIKIDIPLSPFSLMETYLFLEKMGFPDLHNNKKEIIELYITMGGVADYLSKLDPSLSIHKNINNLFFSKKGKLTNEFDLLLDGLFENSIPYKEIIDELLKHPEGLSIDELNQSLDKEGNRNVYNLIDQLLKTNFICSRNMYKPKNVTLYKICDPYIIFYKKWVLPFKNKNITDDDYWTKVVQDNDFSKWAGLAFENICFENIEIIKKELGISGVRTQEHSFRYKPEKKSSAEKGSQIDLIIDRDDGYINICECKFYSSTWDIKDHEKKNFITKKDNFKNQTSISKPIIGVLISVYGAKESSANYKECFKKSILAEDIFFK